MDAVQDKRVYTGYGLNSYEGRSKSLASTVLHKLGGHLSLHRLLVREKVVLRQSQRA